MTSILTFWKLKKLRATLLFALAFLSLALAAQAEPRPFQAAVHVHSRVSGGRHSLQELGHLARHEGLDVLALTDSYLRTVDYGLWPLERVAVPGLNRLVLPSVQEHGLDRYFAEVEKLKKSFPDLLILAGVEVSPSYIWEGSPWSELVLRDFNRDLIIFGLSPEELRDLPVAGNFTWRNTTWDARLVTFPFLLMLAGACFLSFKREQEVRLKYFVVRRSRRLWTPGLVFLLTGTFLAWFNYPFGRFDTSDFNGEAAPYQRVIDYVNHRGGVVYWAHPEATRDDVESSAPGLPASSAWKAAGAARLVVDPYPRLLLETDGYHGFEGLYGHETRAADPGGIWDQTLLDYVKGKRRQSPAVLTGIDFRALKNGGRGWHGLGDGRTVLWMEDKSVAEALRALRQGTSFAAFEEGPGKILIRDFSLLSSGLPVNWNGSGSWPEAHSPVRLCLSLDRLSGGEIDSPVRIEVILDGRLWRDLQVRIPFQANFQANLDSGRHYFRLRISGKDRLLLSNPIFVESRKPLLTGAFSARSTDGGDSL